VDYENGLLRAIFLSSIPNQESFKIPHFITSCYQL
jgi:hypothetical protein